MAIRRKAKAKARGKRKKVPIAKAARKTRKTINKRAKKPSPRPAPPKKTRPTAKNARKPTSVSKRAPEAVRPSPSHGQPIGVVTHYYGHLSVVAMRLEPGATLRVDDVIHIRGHTTDFTQKVESLELDHAPVTEVGPNDDFGLKVAEHAREHDVVFKVRS